MDVTNSWFERPAGDLPHSALFGVLLLLEFEPLDLGREQEVGVLLFGVRIRILFDVCFMGSSATRGLTKLPLLHTISEQVFFSAYFCHGVEEREKTTSGCEARRFSPRTPTSGAGTQ